MTYKILSTRQEGETLYTNVEYDFSGTIVTVDVAHFMPQSTEDVTNGIANRASSEQSKLESAALLPSVIDGLVIGQTITI